MLLIIGTVRVPVGHMDTARSAMSDMITASRAEPGCLQYSYAEDVLDPGLIRVTERWTSRASLADHFESQHIADWRATWAALGIGDRNLTLYEADDGEPC